MMGADSQSGVDGGISHCAFNWKDTSATNTKAAKILIMPDGLLVVEFIHQFLKGLKPDFLLKSTITCVSLLNRIESIKK